MLATVKPELLRRVAFPLGGDTKEGVRAEAARAGLDAAGRPESQEACFLAGDDYRVFLAREGLAPAPGPIVAEDGEQLGRHTGVWGFTPGQRRGIGLSAAEPLYALRTDAGTATLVVGPRRSLATTRVEVAGELYVPADRVEAKFRYRSEAVASHVEPAPGGFTVVPDEPVEAVAPGQVAALYAGGAVVGAGLIAAAR
jgi:tRNA-specific 2-thiouridylase